MDKVTSKNKNKLTTKPPKNSNVPKPNVVGVASSGTKDSGAGPAVPLLYCVACKKVCADEKDESLQCFTCKLWCHATCAGLDEYIEATELSYFDAFAILNKPSDSGNFVYLCPVCCDQPSSSNCLNPLGDRLTAVEDQIEKLVKAIEMLFTENKQSDVNPNDLITTRMESLENKFDSFIAKQSSDSGREISSVLLEHISSLDSKLDNISEKVTSDDIPHSSNQSIKPTYANVAAVNAPLVNYQAAMGEVVDAEYHGKCIVIFGLPESLNDVLSAQEVCCAVDPTAKIKDTSRLGRYVPQSDAPIHSKPRPLRVSFSSSEVVKSILAGTHRLRTHATFAKVFIRKSLTKSEWRNFQDLRKQCKKLNEEVNEPQTKFVVVRDTVLKYVNCQLDSNGSKGKGSLDKSFTFTPSTLN